jgi:hypothetical protein
MINLDCMIGVKEGEKEGAKEGAKEGGFRYPEAAPKVTSETARSLYRCDG